MTSLRVLLAVAEHGTASGAAEAVNLTQSAVSKHLRALEETMGATFFTRGSRGLVPTEAGRIYIKHARTALAELETAGVRISALKASPWSVRLHVLPIIGDRWLLPRFSRFAEQYPDIDVQFTSFVTADTTEAADGTFRFGEGHWPGQRADYLFGRDVALVGAAPLLARMGGLETAADVGRYTVLDHFQTPLRWSEFGAAHGIDGFEPAHTIRFGFYSLVIRAAISGQGLALVPRRLVQEELVSGRLVNPAGLGFKSRNAYWFTVPEDRPVRPGLEAFHRWLLEEIKAS
ncbi:LysR substrate-binding domain-containing protein [Microvirga subterranea]|uniref:DNA-binding transcriptional LysR family regulator n=1 Tax=Microvirga subterranea TaxID=186651 RepID=A0A370HP36_9HYPH|nr:LysR substrate-binding domain-containing protein [Microvirga subterranea]RDI59995.1 DNA-binding transcriptional LysR family regulator [Microvirga subterranea]